MCPLPHLRGYADVSVACAPGGKSVDQFDRAIQVVAKRKARVGPLRKVRIVLKIFNKLRERLVEVLQRTPGAEAAALEHARVKVLLVLAALGDDEGGFPEDDRLTDKLVARAGNHTLAARHGGPEVLMRIGEQLHLGDTQLYELA